jgi:hypothetical protein
MASVATAGLILVLLQACAAFLIAAGLLVARLIQR